MKWVVLYEHTYEDDFFTLSDFLDTQEEAEALAELRSVTSPALVARVLMPAEWRGKAVSTQTNGGGDHMTETKAEKDAKAAEVNPHTGMTEKEADEALRAYQEADDLQHNGGLEDNSLVAANEEAAEAEEKAAKAREADAKKAAAKA